MEIYVKISLISTYPLFLVLNNDFFHVGYIDFIRIAVSNIGTDSVTY